MMPIVNGPAESEMATVSDGEVIATAVRMGRYHDFDAVLNGLRTASPERRARLADEITKKLADQDPAGAVTLAMTLADAWGQTEPTEIAGRALAREKPEVAFARAVEMGRKPEERRLRHVMIDQLVESDSGATFEQIAALPAGTTQDDLLVLAAAAWARRAPELAIAWLRDRPPDDLKIRLTACVGFEVAQVLPDRAVAIAEMLPAGRNRWLLYSAIAETWVAVDSDAAMAWVRNLPSGEPRDAAYAGVVNGFGIPSTRRVANVPGMSTGRTLGGGRPVVVADSNSPTFSAWLATQPPGMSREEAILEYVRQRGALEPMSVGPMIASMPGGPARDQAMSIYVDGLLISSPGEAARWINSLPRSDRSDELIEKTARQWLRTSPDAAADWLVQTTLPLERKQQLLREAGR
jgi:hypothetical protein